MPSEKSDAFGGFVGGRGIGLDAPAHGDTRPKVLIETELGFMTFELFLAEAPITAGNFLRYVDEQRLAGATFYRTLTDSNQSSDEVRIAAIQGGLGAGASNALPPIAHESTDKTKIRHLDGTLSMARYAIGTAASEFFICIGDQPELDFGGARNSDGYGFAAFGRLVGGSKIAREIHERPERDQMLSQPIRILGVARI